MGNNRLFYNLSSFSGLVVWFKEDAVYIGTFYTMWHSTLVLTVVTLCPNHAAFSLTSWSLAQTAYFPRTDTDNNPPTPKFHSAACSIAAANSVYLTIFPFTSLICYVLPWHCKPIKLQYLCLWPQHKVCPQAISQRIFSCLLNSIFRCLLAHSCTAVSGQNSLRYFRPLWQNVSRCIDLWIHRPYSLGECASV